MSASPSSSRSNAVAEAAYQHVIENAISAVERLSDPAALAYLRDEWLPFALSCREAWRGVDSRDNEIGAAPRQRSAPRHQESES